ncbi:hypothetical protein EG327_010226 [Venturia inaequalis]|uniref:Methyltransferase domain-containing protein n=2 Tax=Venturia inaequalis TaxID=5025 RepID=A0A8H3UHC7_VENIN|nr:hypothetical protein EG327_010226 [Venturia inaequalis]
MTISNIPNTVYDLPNTSIEHERLNTQACLTRRVTGNKVVHAPLFTSSIHRILDVGCGPGVVTREFSSRFPKAKIVGIDINLLPILQQEREKEDTGKMSFIEGDIMDLANKHEELGKQSFDYVFSRYLVYALTCWPEYIKKTWDLLKPGAWVEIQDGMLTTMSAQTKNAANLEWEAKLHQADRGLGLDPDIGGELERLVQAAGFVNVRAWEYDVPISTWEGMDEGLREVGEFYQKAMPVLLGSLMRTRLEGRVEGVKIEKYLEEMRRDFEGGEGFYVRFFVVIGQKAE